MQPIYIYTLYDRKTGKPRCVGISKDGNIIIRDLYRPGSGVTIKKILDEIEKIRNLILVATRQNIPIITTDFKSCLAEFDLPITSRHYNVYDVHIPDIKATTSQADDFQIVRKVLDKMARHKEREYQNIIANAAVVYRELETNGVRINYGLQFPKWSQKTFSGRSKTTGFNIQGMTEDFKVSLDDDDNILIHLDWICADIRIASLLSQDARLIGAFENSDPYETMQLLINAESTDQITREESKRYLLKSINSMDFTSLALTDAYPDLGKWIHRCRKKLDKDGYLETILHRKFRKAHAKNELAVLNGVMQGSVAHAMQLVIRKIWEKLPCRLIAEIHDSLVLTSSDSADLNAMLEIVAPIMLHPFEGILEDNPAFPFKVSIGKKWRKWKWLSTYRESGVTRGTKNKTTT